MTPVDQRIAQRLYFFGNFHQESSALLTALPTVYLKSLFRKLNGGIYFSFCRAMKFRVQGSIRYRIKCTEGLTSLRRLARAHKVVTGYSHRNACFKKIVKVNHNAITPNPILRHLRNTTPT